jgi:hypothetical protein
MKMDKDFAMIAGILFVVILLTLAFSNSGITGFYKSSGGLVEYPYEGFSDIQEAYEMREDDEGFKEGDRGRRRQRKPAAAVVNTTNSYINQMPNKKQGFKTKVEGFEGLQSGPIDEQIIGFMYNNEASTTCKGYGYTTSKGNICMSDADIKLLTTRGMNATGVSDQIGA